MCATCAGITEQEFIKHGDNPRDGELRCVSCGIVYPAIFAAERILAKRDERTLRAMARQLYHDVDELMDTDAW